MGRSFGSHANDYSAELLAWEKASKRVRRDSRRTTAAKIVNGIATALVVTMFVCILALVGGKPLGYHPYTVLSGSMEPAYHVGSLVYVKEVSDPEELQVGQVITFLADRDTTVTHRINNTVTGDDGQLRFETKGDANDAADEALVHPDNVVGTPVFSIPKAGYLLEWLKAPPGTYVAVSFAALAVFLMFLPDLIAPSKRDEDERGERHNGYEEAPRGKHSRPAVAAAAYAQQHAQSQAALPQQHTYTHHSQPAYGQRSPYPQTIRPQQRAVPRLTQTPSGMRPVTPAVRQASYGPTPRRNVR